MVVTDGAFAAAVGGFLLMHYQLLSANCTTIEMYEKDRIHPWPYNKGFRRNFEEVFGRRWGAAAVVPVPVCCAAAVMAIRSDRSRGSRGSSCDCVCVPLL